MFNQLKNRENIFWISALTSLILLILIKTIPFYNPFFQIPRRVVYMPDVFIIFITCLLLTRISWIELFNKYLYIIISLLFFLIIPIYSSLILNTATNYLFWPGFFTEILPIVFCIILYFANEKKKIIISQRIYIGIGALLMVHNLLFNLININPNNIILPSLLGFIYAYIGSLKFERINKNYLIYYTMLIFLINLVISPKTIIFSIIFLIFLHLKMFAIKNISKIGIPLILISTILAGLSNNFTNIDNSSYHQTTIALFKLITDKPQKLIFGYGAGNIGQDSVVNYGYDQLKYNSKPLIVDLNINSYDKLRLDSVSTFFQLLVNNGILGLGLFYSFIIFILIMKKRKDHTVLLLTFILAISLFIDIFSDKFSMYLLSLFIILL